MLVVLPLHATSSPGAWQVGLVKPPVQSAQRLPTGVPQPMW